MSQLNVLVTGAASGIGRAVTETFAAKGHRVIAVDVEAVETTERIIPFRADVRREDELEAVLEGLRADRIVLDAILNFAGVHSMTSLIEGDSDSIRRVIDVNVVGTMLVNRLLHPVLSPSGRIVILTSEVAGYAPMPFNGLYSVSKTALDCYAQALRQELGLIGQSVITLRPGAVETPLCRNSLTATEKLAETTVLYQSQASHFLSLTRRFMGKPMSADRLAEKVYRITVAKHPRLVYNINRSPWLRLLGLLPLRLQCFVIRTVLNRKTGKNKNGARK